MVVFMGSSCSAFLWIVACKLTVCFDVLALPFVIYRLCYVTVSFAGHIYYFFSKMKWPNSEQSKSRSKRLWVYILTQDFQSEYVKVNYYARNIAYKLTTFDKYGTHLFVKRVFSKIHSAAERNRQSAVETKRCITKTCLIKYTEYFSTKK